MLDVVLASERVVGGRYDLAAGRRAASALERGAVGSVEGAAEGGGGGGGGDCGGGGGGGAAAEGAAEGAAAAADADASIEAMQEKAKRAYENLKAFHDKKGWGGRRD